MWDRFVLWLRGFVRPDWRELGCPDCYVKLRARNGVHMTRAIRRHNRIVHGVAPPTIEDLIGLLQDYEGPDPAACPTCGAPGHLLPTYHDSTHERFMCGQGHHWAGAPLNQ